MAATSYPVNFDYGSMQGGQQGQSSNWLASILGGQTPGWGQILPSVIGLASGLFGSSRENSLQKYAEQLMRARLTAQDNFMQSHAALARQNFDESVARRRAFHEGEVATGVRNLTQGLAAHGAGPGADTRNDVFNAVLASEGERAFNQDYDRLSQQYLANLQGIERPDVQSALDVGGYAFPMGLYQDQQEQGRIDALLEVGRLIGGALDNQPGRSQPAQQGQPSHTQSPNDFGSYWNSIFDMQHNNNMQPVRPYLRWDAPSAAVSY